MSRFAIGSYTHHPSLDAQGDGITIVDWDNKTDTFQVASANREIVNPSYLAWISNSRHLYSISEVDDRMGGIALYSLTESGQLIFIQQQKGPGKSACHLLVQPDRKRVYTASYSEGSLTAYALENHGIGLPVMMRLYTGNGPNQERQKHSHAHQISFSPFSNHFYICDLGSDTVWMHTPGDIDNADIPPGTALSVPPGYGPRHLAFDTASDLAYVLCELVPRLLVCRLNRDTGEMDIIQELDTVANDRMAIAAPAAVKVHPSGKSLAVSNRFDDTIAVFSIDRSGNLPLLALADRFPCGGKAPRDIEFDRFGTRLFIANQDSHNVSCRHFIQDTGMPDAAWAEDLPTGSPVCIVMLDDPA